MTQLPWYLSQSDQELKKKFNFIQNEEDKRLREATTDLKNVSRWSLGVSIQAKNDFRNRYVNIMPYERNRVHLNVLKGNDYVNASYVKVEVPHQSTSAGYYIATQGPTKNTWGQFWQMCYNECPWDDIVIVMVTPLVEHGREKCFPYWPLGLNNNDMTRIIPSEQYPSGNEDDLSAFGQSLEVKYETSERFDDQYTLTTLKLIPRGEDKISPTKTVHHFYFDQWRDMSKPQEVIPIMELCQHSHRLNSNGNPIVVHCSAGVGRSGTFIALDHLIHDTVDFHKKEGSLGLEPKIEYKKDLIEQIVLQLRSQRMKMVQMSDQFKFVYHAARYLYEVAGNDN
ncbi:tyrosine-protein phosphatase 1 [Monosporozyma unispora]|nr:tyrosine protein phosphatase 1 [Kazachstania unispora]